MMKNIRWTELLQPNLCGLGESPSHANAYQALQKIVAVGIVPEYRAPFNVPDHDMVNGSGSVNSGFP